MPAPTANSCYLRRIRTSAEYGAVRGLFLGDCREIYEGKGKVLLRLHIHSEFESETSAKNKISTATFSETFGAVGDLYKEAAAEVAGE
ncbi:hypothetical protein SUGI_0083870 [Cryptomeria japonica]|nr:hypothetical protein SUGI_0083870 [Cryptomeria japonica]